ncbi:MAG: mannose-1-phosphate guanylyltransferase [Armatimonadota bacterium]
MFAVVMAGGGGTRLWPRSREQKPKQMHALVGDKPLVQETTDHLQHILGYENVYIVANQHHSVSILEAMPYMKGKIIIDPYRRDTAACIGLAAVYLSKIDPSAVMGVFPADPFIGSEKEFGEAIHAGIKLAEDGHVVTIGIRPTGPETGYGYIETDGEFAKIDDQDIYKVKRFVEKPTLERAIEYCEAGCYLWNSGMFIWSIPIVLSLFEKYLPDTYARLMIINDAIGTPQEAEIVDREYKEMQKISVDYGIMEKLDDILVIPGKFDWNDIGNWSAVRDIRGKDANGNVIEGKHITIDTTNCLILGAEEKIVAAIGVDDLVIVDTEEALLICHKDRVQDVKKIVDELREHNLEQYL